MNVKIRKGTASGNVNVCASKSFAHRMLICAALAEGKSIIRGISQSEDISATIDCIRSLGAQCTMRGDTAEIYGRANFNCNVAIFPCRESGSTLRFMLPVALVCGDKACFKGTARLMERGIGVYEQLLSEKGISFSYDTESVAVCGRLKGGEYNVTGNISSQFITGLLLALPVAEKDSIVRILPPVESKSYIDITVAVLKQFGITISKEEEYVYRIKGGQHYRCIDASVEGDWSNAAFLYALNELGGNVEIQGLDTDSAQGDRCCVEFMRTLQYGGKSIDISDCPDLGPILFVVSAAKHGAVFTGTRRLRIKESDRAQAMAEELRKFGVDIVVEENRVIIAESKLRKPESILCGHNDHRIVMSLSVLASIVGAEISGAQAVAKSYPDFFEVLQSLGLKVQKCS